LLRPDSLPALFLAGLLTAGSAFAATPRQLEIDLAAIDPGSERTLQTPPGEYTITIVNRVPKAVYDVEATVSFLPLDPLPVPGSRGELKADDPCVELATATTELLHVQTEAGVPEKVAGVKDLLADGCTEPIQLRLAERALASTRQDMPDIYRLDNGQELKVAISRRDGTNRKQWTVVYKTPARGRWFSSYGFVFVHNEDQRFFAEAKPGVTGRYVISRKADHQDYDFAPSIFYSWLPAGRESRNLNLGAAAGLGFDQSNPILFAGPMLSYNQSLSLLAGVVMHKQKILNGIYSPGQEITENLSAEQLQEETYHPAFFLGLSFRFGANPFSGPSESESRSSAASAKSLDKAPKVRE
jgi:hypothetical protein